MSKAYGFLKECGEMEMRARIPEECLILQKRFGEVGMEHFRLFRVKVENVKLQ